MTGITMKARPFALAGLLTCAGLAVAGEPCCDDKTWVGVTDDGPIGRMLTSIAYDSVRERTVLFSGFDGFAGPGDPDTWEFDGATWTDVTPAFTPPARYAHAMVYDEINEACVLFGGQIDVGGPPVLGNDMWLWNGAEWTELTGGLRPSARRSHMMAYDKARGKIVLFGGLIGQTIVGDTWEFDSATQTWTPVSNSGPGPRLRFGMAYDEISQRVLLYGGQRDTTGLIMLEDTWAWTGLTWVEVTPAGDGPGRRRGLAMATDANCGRVVLFGGSTLPANQGSSISNDTWEWTGAQWIDVTPTSPEDRAAPRAVHTMAYDSTRNEAIVFGGAAGANLLNATAVWGVFRLGDLTGDGQVGFADLSILLAAWGACDGCAADLDGNGSVGFSDLSILLANWGGCG
jgi:hypothetical protein